MKKRSIAAIVIVILAAVFLLGPRPRVHFQPGAAELPEDLDRYLAESEAKFGDLVVGTEKAIFWADASKRKTPFSMVYLHGYSASRQDTAPLAQRLADRLGANLYASRLTGHGRSAEAMGQATAEDWLSDAMEAMEIGRRIGQQVIVMGSSTGGTLAAWLASRVDPEPAAAYILISPNFAPRQKASELLTWPWARQVLLPLRVGPEYRWEPLSEAMARYWTERYPSVSLIEMMSLVKYVRGGRLEAIDRPLQVIYSPEDRIVDPEWIRRAFARIGSPAKQIVAITETSDPTCHTLAGDILAPDDTETIEALIARFLTTNLSTTLFEDN